MIPGTDLLAALPMAVYTTDANGRITFYNEAAAELWGHRPEIGSAEWCGSWRLYWPDGRPLPHDQCPMAIALKEGRPVRGVEAVAERPDGTRVEFIPYPTPLKDDQGRIVGAVNMLVDIGDRKQKDIESARLAAIVSSSDDAIISKTLNSIVTSWNAGATRIFGYQPEEMIGQSITRLIPPELLNEEDEILAKLKRGERIEHYDTVRIGKDGRRLHISLTVSPLRDSSGTIVGASKVARDVTERKRSEELQRLLFDELNHRVKNTLAIIQAIASQSLRRARSPSDFVASFNGRVQALARAHDLLVQAEMKGADVMEIVREQVMLGTPDARVSSSGPRLMLESRTAVQVALVLHELATNARKYGALSVPTGALSISWNMRQQQQSQRELSLEWRESGVPSVTAPTTSGFGTTLIERMIETSGGAASLSYGADGLICTIKLPLPQEEDAILAFRAPANPSLPHISFTARASAANLEGKRILVVEDEALVAIDIEAHLTSAGCKVIGPAGTIKRAKQLILDEGCDAALVDANLAGRRVDTVAAMLTEKGVPFAFSTGYGRGALPAGFHYAPVLTKPFNPDELLGVIGGLLSQEGRSPGVVALRPRKPSDPRPPSTALR